MDLGCACSCGFDSPRKAPLLNCKNKLPDLIKPAVSKTYRLNNIAFTARSGWRVFNCVAESLALEETAVDGALQLLLDQRHKYRVLQ